MEWTQGARFGPYEITGSLGAGGMGEVYRARDLKLDRQVAIKILPRLFAEDPERRARFDREARALASLNHPNIAQIYGAEEADGATAIVMELVEGEDLARRIARGPLTWIEAQPIARQIAEALDAAHERGIIHRDLKPANIRITPDETVKILDFGLAKAMAGNDTLAQDPSLSPTLTSPSTRLGTILGTAAYMAPEQAKGRSVDKRVDIWAFGCVLFEMLTGRSPFASDTAVESLGLIVMKDPDWTALAPTVPPRIVELMRRCLMKDPKQRLRDMGDASFLLAHPGDASAEPSSSEVSPDRRRWLLTGALGLTLAAAVAVVAWSLKPSASIPLRSLELPEVVAGSRSVALSPDGTRLAYMSQGRLFVRELKDTTPRDLAAAPPASDWLFWSPDSRTLGVAAEGAIRTIPAAGGPLFTVCRIPAAGRLMGIAWRADGSIVFAAWRDSVYTVPSTGGTPEPLLKVDPKTEIDFHDVSIAPGGRLLVGVHQRDGDMIRTELVDGSRRTVLTDDPGVRDVRYVPPGFLLFRRTGTNHGLWALPFSDRALDLARAVLVTPGATSFSAADEGTLVVRSDAPPASALVWVARDGTTTSTPGSPIPDLVPWIALSPRADRVAFLAGPRGQTALFLRDLSTGADTRRTMESSTAQSAPPGTDFTMTSPAWFPKGDRVLYASGGVESSKLFAQPANGTVEPTEFGMGMFGRVSPDGKWLLWLQDDRGQGRMRYASMDANDKLGEAKLPFPGSDKVDVRWFDLSPDGRLLVYTAVEPGLMSNIYLTEFPGGGARWQVTTGGGAYPRFSRDGRELFFMSGVRPVSGAPEGRLMVMPLTVSPSVKLGVAEPLLSGDAMPSGFDVAPDDRLLVARGVPVRPGEGARAVLVQNWPASLTGG